MADPFRFGLVGTGAISAAHVAGILERPGIAVLVAACDPAPAGLAAMSDRVAGLRTFGDIDSMLATVELDGLIICTPHALHVPQALSAIQHGVPAIVEKPAATTTTELRELHAAAADAGVFILPGQMQRFDRTVRWIDAAISADPEFIGEPRTFAIDCLQDLRTYATDPSHWLYDGAVAGGGVAISVAVHKLDLLRHLSRRDFVRVDAAARYEAPFRNGAESAITATLQMTDGLIGTLHGDYLAARSPYSESLKLIGATGTLAVHPDLGSFTGPLLVATARQGAAGGSFAGFERLEPASGLTDLAESPFENQMLHFVDIVRGAVAPRNSLEINFNTIATIEALMRSARERREVLVETF